MNQELLLPQAKIDIPLVQVIDNIASPTRFQNELPTKTITKSLDEIFPEQQHEDKRLKRAKEVLGELSSSFSSQELKDLVVQMQYLVESWLDDFEREVFDGQTLKEILHERGGI